MQKIRLKELRWELNSNSSFDKKWYNGNVKKTKIQFLEDKKYNIPVKTIIKNLEQQLNMKKEK